MIGNIIWFTGYYEERDKDNPFFFLWIAAAIINSFYGYIWDVKIDWGLFDKSAGENKYLREEIVYTPGVSNERCILLIASRH